MAITLATTLRNNRANAITTYAGTSAKLRLYTAAYATQLVECVCNGTAFAAAASGGVLTANAIADGTATASGNAAIARLYQTDGATMVMEGLTVSDSGGSGDIKLQQTGTSISSGQTVSVSSFVSTEGNA